MEPSLTSTTLSLSRRYSEGRTGRLYFFLSPPTVNLAEIQEAYNEEHGITPTTIKKAVRDLIAVSKAVAETEVKLKKDPESMSKKELKKFMEESVTDFIKNGVTDESYNTFVETAKAIGVERYIELYQNAYDAYLAK